MSNLPFELSVGEELLKHEPAMWRKAKVNFQPGRIYLTNKRLLFRKNSNPFAGVLLKLIFKSARSSVVFDIPLKRIEELSKECFGANKNIMVVKYNNGAIAKLSLNKSFDDWKSEIEALKL